MNFSTVSYFVAECCDQPPAGAIAVTVRARPRRSSSKATHPPSEFPTMWAVSQPSWSIRRSTSSTSMSVCSSQVGERCPPWWPSIVGAKTS